MSESLERSHSVKSNFKLTLIAVLLAFSVSCLFITLGFKNHLNNTLFITLTSILGALTVIFIILFRGFKR